MRLTDAEFRGMNNPVRRLFQRRLEFPVFRRLGLRDHGQDILEIGCGSGYGAVLLSGLQPRSYVGIDLMPEMIELAAQRALPGAEFLVMDAADMAPIADGSKDVVVIFGILHHIPQWKKVAQECHRVLRPGAKLFVEEPTAGVLRWWDAFFRWNHPEEALFTRKELEDQLQAAGFSLVRRIGLLGFWSFCFARG